MSRDIGHIIYVEDTLSHEDWFGACTLMTTEGRS